MHGERKKDDRREEENKMGLKCGTLLDSTSAVWLKQGKEERIRYNTFGEDKLLKKTNQSNPNKQQPNTSKT